MRRLILILLLSLPVFSSIGFAAEPAERIAATLNGKVIFLSDLHRHQAFFENVGKNGSEEDLKNIGTGHREPAPSIERIDLFFKFRLNRKFNND